MMNPFMRKAPEKCYNFPKAPATIKVSIAKDLNKILKIRTG